LIAGRFAITVGVMFAALFLLVVVVAYRIFSGFLGSGDYHWLHNFAPVAAVALCGAVYLPRRTAAVLPIAMLFISDLVLNLFHYHQPFFTFDILPRYAALALISALGFALRGRSNVLRLLAASFVGSLVFYVITNTGSWLSDPGITAMDHRAYAKTAAGWFQAMTTGLPGYPSTWWFYRYTLISDLFYTLLFAVCMSVQFKSQATQPLGEQELARS
jgi:hypothetical protein